MLSYCSVYGCCLVDESAVSYTVQNFLAWWTVDSPPQPSASVFHLANGELMLYSISLHMHGTWSS